MISAVRSLWVWSFSAMPNFYDQYAGVGGTYEVSADGTRTPVVTPADAVAPVAPSATEPEPVPAKTSTTKG